MTTNTETSTQTKTELWHGEFNTTELKLKGFKVYEVEQAAVDAPVFNRRDYYKVSLMDTKCLIHYAHQSLEVDGQYLFFSNPHIPYAMEWLSEQVHSYSCLFTEEFMKAGDRSESLHQSPLFQIGSTPLFKLTEAQAAYVKSIFQKMLAEQEADYAFKGDLIRTYVQLLNHEALHMLPADTFHQHKNGSSRIAALFLELLERQFPIDNPAQKLGLKTAQEFADRLAVHVNHLNRAVKEVTGKPTSAHIAGRIVDEAKALLLHTDWSVATVAYSLGFEYPTYFNNFFKKHTGTTPLAVRRVVKPEVPNG